MMGFFRIIYIIFWVLEISSSRPLLAEETCDESLKLLAPHIVDSMMLAPLDSYPNEEMITEIISSAQTLAPHEVHLGVNALKALRISLEKHFRSLSQNLSIADLEHPQVSEIENDLKNHISALTEEKNFPDDFWFALSMRVKGSLSEPSTSWRRLVHRLLPFRSSTREVLFQLNGNDLNAIVLFLNQYSDSFIKRKISRRKQIFQIVDLPHYARELLRSVRRELGEMERHEKSEKSKRNPNLVKKDPTFDAEEKVLHLSESVYPNIQNDFIDWYMKQTEGCQKQIWEMVEKFGKHVRLEQVIGVKKLHLPREVNFLWEIKLHGALIPTRVLFGVVRGKLVILDFGFRRDLEIMIQRASLRLKRIQ